MCKSCRDGEVQDTWIWASPEAVTNRSGCVVFVTSLPWGKKQRLTSILILAPDKLTSKGPRIAATGKKKASIYSTIALMKPSWILHTLDDIAPL